MSTHPFMLASRASIEEGASLAWGVCSRGRRIGTREGDTAMPRSTRSRALGRRGSYVHFHELQREALNTRSWFGIHSGLLS